MKIIAHRGVSKMAPENSIEAIALTKELGLEAVEFDIRITKDGKLVVFHDRTLKRLAGDDRSIDSINYKDLIKIQLKNGAYIPSFEDALKAAQGLYLVIEGKDTGWAEPLAKYLNETKIKNKYRVISFNCEELDKFNHLKPGTDTYILIFLNSFKAIKLAKEHKFIGIGIFYFGLNSFIYKLTKKAKLKLNIYTLNSSVIAQRIKNKYPGIDITTNVPIKLKSRLK